MQSSPRIDELKQKFHENPRRYFAPLANEYRKAGDPEQAIAICRAHLAQQPGHMSGHVVYGQALYDAGRIDEAKVVFQQALALDPENLIVLRHLGDIARRRGEDAEARSWYSRALDGDPQDAEVAAYLAELTEPLAVSPPDESARVATEPTSEEPQSPAPADEREPEPQVEAEPLVEAEPQVEPQLPAARADDFEIPEIESIGHEQTDLNVPMATEAGGFDDSMFDDFSLAKDVEVVTAASPYADLTGSTEMSDDVQLPEDSPYLEETGPMDLSAEAPPAVDTESPESTEEAALADETAAADMEEEGSPVSATPEPEAPRENRASRFTPEFERTPIVTRTLAELYLQQGYIESALEIYRQLAEREPDDASLRDRITELSGLGITHTNEWQEPSVPPAEPEESETEAELEAMAGEEGDFDIGPMMPSEEPVAEAEVSELGASSELWDTADSWSSGLFDESEETAEIFATSAMDDAPEPEAAATEYPFSEAPWAKTPAVEVPAEEEPKGHPAPYADEPRRITIREFFATLGEVRPPATDVAESIQDDVEAPVADSIAEEESYPYADDAFATLFENEPVDPEDSRAAAALSGAVAHAAPESPLAASRETGPSRDSGMAREVEQPAKESEEDIRRFREWLEGLANS